MDYVKARRNMVEGQLRPNKVLDPVILEAMETLPRELFVPKPLRGVSYVDEDIHLGDGRFLLEPSVVARLLQAAGIKHSDSALVVGCAAPYTAALVSRLAASVVAVEGDGARVAAGTQILNEVGIDNVVIVEGDPRAGVADQAPFDVIVFDGAAEDVPEPILSQLAEGGRLVVVLSGARGMGEATLFERRSAHVSRRPLFDAGTPTLPGFQRAPAFVF